LRTVLAALLALVAFAGLGAGAAQLRTSLVMQAPFEGREEPLAVQGWVIANDANDNEPRLRLLVHSLEGVARPPRYVRFSVAEADIADARPRGALLRRAWPTRGGDGPGRLRFRSTCFLRTSWRYRL